REMQHAPRPRDAELVAGRGALVVDRAAYLLADAAFERRAARLALVGAFHAAPQIVDVFGERHRHRATRRVVGLGPVERHAEMGAARATGHAWVFAHTRSFPTSVFRRKPAHCAPMPFILQRSERV